MFLFSFSEIKPSTWILIGALAILAIVLIVIICRHLVASIFVLIIVGCLVSFYFLNSYLGFDFTQKRSAKALCDGDLSQYETYDIGNSVVYVKKFDNQSDNFKPDCFAVSKVLFFYKRVKPTTLESKTDLNIIKGSHVINGFTAYQFSNSKEHKYIYYITYNNSTFYENGKVITYVPQNVKINDEAIESKNLYVYEYNKEATKIEIEGSTIENINK